MPVVFIVTPNPVPFTQAEVNQKVRKPATVTWDTGSASVKGRIFKALNGTAAVALPDVQNIAAKIGKVADSTGYSDTVDYTLRDTANKILATVTLRSALLIPPPPPRPPRPFIYDIRIIPRGDAIWLTFDTTLPSAPWVELIDASPPWTLCGIWARPEVNTSHAMMFDGMGGVPLRQNHSYTFRIVLDKNRAADPQTNPSVSGVIVTGSRVTTVRFTGADLKPFPFLPGGYAPSLDLYFAAGDVESQTVSGWRHTGELLYAGGSIFLTEQPIVITPPGRAVWACAMGQYTYRSGISAKFTTDLSNQPVSAPGPGTSYQSDESELIVSTSSNFDISAGVPRGPDWAPVVPPHIVLTQTLSSASSKAVYDVSLVIEVNHAEGFWQFDEASKDEEHEYLLAQVEQTTFAADAQAIMHGKGTRMSIELSPAGDLIVSRHTSVTEQPNVFLLKGPVRQGAAILLDDDRLHIVAKGVDGELLSTTVGARPHDTSWISLGLNDVRSIASAQASGGSAHIIVLIRNGELLHALHRATGRTEWTPLARQVRSFAAITSPDTEVRIIVVHDDGSIAHTIVTEDETARWESIGSTRPGELSAALHEDGSLSLLVEDDDKQIRLLGLPDHTSPTAPFDWHNLGTRDEVTARLLPKASTTPHSESEQEALRGR